MIGTLSPFAADSARSAALLLVGVLSAGSSVAEDWPQFRGPDGQGHSGETGLPVEWSESENLRFRRPVPGRGWSSPVVVDGVVWLTTAVEERSVSLRLLAFDASSGEPVLDREVFVAENPRPRNAKNSHASPTPIVEDGVVYVHFGADGTAAVTTDGEILWTARFPYRSQHGNGGSATLWRDLVILSCDGDDRAFVVALDKKTGKVRWRTPRRGQPAQAYSTPLVISVDGRDQVVSVGAFRAVAYDPESGREIWWVTYGDGFSNVPRPVYSHGLVFLSTGFGVASLLAVRPDGRGDVTDTHIAWKQSRGAPHTPSPVVVGDHLYVVSDRGVATCVDVRTGELQWQERLGGNHSASPVFADGRLYFQSEDGATVVVEPGPTYRELARSHLDDATFASPAVSGRSIYVRSSRYLYRFAIDG